ncbi:MAG: M6 family metalloprotease domain-containing protein [Bacteroidaceae bacterium]|nr:M6 family metalloprotease domain-containing protein [Prevotellaceae bacterium]MDY5632836.1 M6 family metalloprotease domain-containing protein [Bacteroidaceae bacterium]
MKRFFSLAAAIMMAASLFAVPAKRITRTFTLADGKQITATLAGDEHGHYWKGTNGIRYELKSDGTLSPIVDSVARKARAQKRIQAKNTRRAQRIQKMRKSKALSGNKKGLVILVNFTDTKFTFAQSNLKDAFSKEGYKNEVPGIGTLGIGSVRDYFLAQSYNKLDIDFNVVGPVNLSKSMASYGADNGGKGEDADAAGMVVEAIDLVDSQVNFKDYDWDGDGEVEQVYVIYAGYGQAQGAPANTIWPHEWDLESAKKGPLTRDGVKINTYACSNELMGSGLNDKDDFRDANGKPVLDGIGTACHEFSHCLGFPDSYDTEDKDGVNYGMGSWDLMCSGSYNGMSYIPAGYNSYQRKEAGWLTPTELTTFTEVSALPALSSQAQAYIIYNQKNRDEYYLLENRQAEDWDSELEAAGMLVLHLDYDADVWMQNEVNNTETRQRMTIIPADGKASEDSEGEDTWPQTGKTELTNTSSPAAILYNENSDGRMFLNFPIRDIKQNEDGTISFVAGNKNIATPVALDATNVTPTSFTANWQQAEGATKYRVVVTEKNDNPVITTIINEDFNKLKADKDGSTDLASQLDSYTTMPGWTGTKVYVGALGTKIGTGKVAGELATPSFKTTGNTSVTITAASWVNSSGDADGGTLTVSIAGKTIGEIPLDKDLATRTFYFEGDGSEMKIEMKATKRAYIAAVKVEKGGNKTVEQIVEGTSATFTELDATKTYTYVVYALEGSYSSPASNIIIVGQTNAIHGIEAQGKGSALYDLNGRRISGRPAQGLYILNGKKVVIK